VKVAFDSPATARRGTLPFSRDDDTGRGGSLRALLTPTRHLTLHGHRTAARTHSGHLLTIRHVRIRLCARARHRRCDCPKTAGALSRSHDHARRHEALPRLQDDSFDTRRRRATTMGPAAGSALPSEATGRQLWRAGIDRRSGAEGEERGLVPMAATGRQGAGPSVDACEKWSNVVRNEGLELGSLSLPPTRRWRRWSARSGDACCSSWRWLRAHATSEIEQWSDFY